MKIQHKQGEAYTNNSNITDIISIVSSLFRLTRSFMKESLTDILEYIDF